ncbi:MAG: outer membrane protein transport protein [Gammaproteobacteria bacterium]
MQRLHNSFIGMVASSLVLTSISTAILAGPKGSEFDLTLTPASGGMEGVGVVRPQDPVAMLFGNPSTLTQLNGDNAFTIGGTFVSPDLRSHTNDGVGLFGGPPGPTNPGIVAPGSRGKSDFGEGAVPHAAALHRINPDMVVGIGLTGISGLGSDFRNEAGFAPLIADLKLFGGNMVVGYQVTPELSIGGAVTIGIGALQAGLASNSASVNAFGIGGTVGATYDAGLIQLGGTYKSPLDIEYKRVTETSQGVFSNLDLEQPQEVTFGIATTDAFMKDTFVEVNFRYKNWDDANGYQDFWKDQYIFSVGGQHRMPTRIGPVTLRAGYSYSSDLAKDRKDLGNSFGNFTQVFVPGQGVLPVTPAFIEVAQTTITNGFWSQGVSFGIGYDITPKLTLDLNTSYAFDGNESFSGDLRSEGSIFSAGMGLTWNF